MKCRRCGYCCTLIPVISFSEMLRIMLHGHINFTEKDIKGKLCIKLVGKDCYFLERNDDRTTSCKIYSIRPKVCRDFPGTEECSIDKRSFKERMINFK
jgi:Fe-S-cluster containining protein